MESPQSRRTDDRNDCLKAQVLSQVGLLRTLPATHAARITRMQESPVETQGKSCDNDL
jgi:hypothetical protein